MKTNKTRIPNTLWTYWESNSPSPPPIVKLCRKSWSTSGRFREVNFLTPTDLPDYLNDRELPATFHQMPPVKKANAVRLSLLSKYGGHWCDAGVLTTAPVDAWVAPKATASGFFVFRDVDKSRILDTWFISGTPHSEFLAEWRNRYQRFFDRTRLHEAHSLAKTPSRLATHIIVAINKQLRSSPHRTALWAKYPLSILPMYPYFVMHYIANSLLEEPNLRREFSNMETVKASRALAMRGVLDANKLTRDAAHELSRDMPIHKLNTYRTYSSNELSILESLIECGADPRSCRSCEHH